MSRESNDINNEEFVNQVADTNNINTNTIENEITNKPDHNKIECSTIGCNNKAEYKITTLDHQFVYTCLKHHDSTIKKGNVFNIIILEE
jgi:hypothetical protein